MSKYAYSPLSSDSGQAEIRLITLLPGHFEDDIRCQLKQYGLDDSQRPDYEALSYVWGDATVTRPITLEDFTLNVTTNLEAALRRLRHAEKERLLWVDAISIDQENYPERASQVLLMGKIYQSAKRVVVWLGEGTAESETIFELLNDLDLDMPEEEWLNYVRQNPLPDIFNHALVDLVSRDWWKRIWVTQEHARARDILFACGRDSASSAKLDYVLSYISHAPLQLQHLYSASNAGSIGFIAFWNHWDICSYTSAVEQCTLLDLVASCRHLQATDPRDKVYALLGLTTNSVNGDMPESILKPDYSASNSTLDVYRDLVDYSLACKTLDLICLRRRYDELGKDWPSWIPDLADIPCAVPNFLEGLSFVAWPLINKFVSITDGLSDPSLIGAWHAAGDTTPLAWISKSPPILHAKGIYLDLTNDMGEPYFLEDGRPDWSISKLSRWDEIILRNFGNCKDQNMNDVFYVSDQLHRLSLIHRREGETSNLVPRTEGAREMLKAWLRRKSKSRRNLLKQNPDHDTDYIGGGTIIEAYIRTLFLDDVLDYGKASSKGYEMFTAGTWRKNLRHPQIKPRSGPGFGVFGGLLHRTLLISAKGYIGLGPVPAQKGDMICVLYGCSVPVLIRQVEDHHLLIGECYVHGLMQGQALDLLKAGKAEETNFILH